MLHEKLIRCVNDGGIIHIRGEPGAGKTLLASRIAAEASRGHRVEWLCMDGKTAFTETLMRNINHVSGLAPNVTILQPRGHIEARATILSIRENIASRSSIFVIDPLTRVLDMGRQSSEMWGRELFEEILPTIAGIAIQHSVCFLVTSEVRMIGETSKPIHYEKIRQWTDVELLLERVGGKSQLYLIGSDEELTYIGDMTMTTDGIVEVNQSSKEREVSDCSESRCTA